MIGADPLTGRYILAGFAYRKPYPRSLGSRPFTLGFFPSFYFPYGVCFGWTLASGHTAFYHYGADWNNAQQTVALQTLNGPQVPGFTLNPFGGEWFNLSLRADLGYRDIF